MAVVSQNTKYVKLDDGVSFALVRTNPKLTTNTKLMYNGKKLYMESYASSPLLNRTVYKNVSVRSNSTYNKDISKFLLGSGTQAYSVYQNFSDETISDSYDNQFETLYWCGAEYIDSNFYTEEIGFIAPLYLREKLPNYFLIFRLDTPSNYNLNVDNEGNPLDSSFDFKTDILDKAVLIKTFDLREGTPLGNYIHNYIEQDGFEFDKSMYVNFSNSVVTYYGINKGNGVLEKKVESFEHELLDHDKPVLKDDKWFTEGFERNNLIFPYIMNIEYLFDDDNFTHGDNESYDFARYIGLYCNNIEFGEFVDLNELKESADTKDDVIYYFEDNKKILHRYVNKESVLKIDGKDSVEFDENLISGFEEERITGYAEPLDFYEGFINRAQYGFEIVKSLEPGDWIGLVCDNHFEYYFADNTYIDGESNDVFNRFYVGEDSGLNDIVESLVKSINRNKKSKFEAKCSDNTVLIYTKREGKEYNGSLYGGAKMLFEASMLYNGKISLQISKYTKHFNELDGIYDDKESDIFKLYNEIRSSLGDFYVDYFCGACDAEMDESTETYKNIFKIYMDEYVFFDLDRYLKTNNGDGRKIITNMLYINGEGKIDKEYRLVIVEDIPEDKKDDNGYDISVSSTCQVEIMDKFKPNHGVLSWFPVKDFDFDMNYSIYGQYSAFVDECNDLSKKLTYKQLNHIVDTYADSDSRSTYEDSTNGIKELAKSPFFDDYGNSFETEYDYYLEQYHPELCLVSKTAPYILKWGYFDEQKDSCENPYRLNINKVFGVSNLSSNTYLRNCDENHYTHSMPYFMTFGTIDYHKDYQYITSDEIYRELNEINRIEDLNGETLTFFDCVDYWVNMFMRTDEDMFSHFFSGKKYGNRFDRKYSRLLCGDKFHNPSTMFRGVRFEAVRQFNGVEKRSSEYNDYKFSFVYIPVMIDSMIFNSTVYFVKNDTFKFIVGMIFVNTMLGTYDHNIFNESIDYFNKGFLYSACKDIIRPENKKKYSFNLNLTYDDETKQIEIEKVNNVVWENNYDMGSAQNEFYMWKVGDNIIVTKKREFVNVDLNKDFEVLGEFNIVDDIEDGIKKISRSDVTYTLSGIHIDNNEINEIKVTTREYYEEFDATIYRKKQFEYYGSVVCNISAPDIEFNDNIFVDICDVEWDYREKDGDKTGYIVDVSEIHLKSESLRNILINMGIEDSVLRISFYDINDNIKYKDFNNSDIKVDIESGVITITPVDGSKPILESMLGIVEDLRINIKIKDIYDSNLESLGLKNYFTIFDQISMYNITESINSDYNVKYYSTVEDNKYKIRVIEPDSIEIEDKYEAIPVKITQNNKSVIGSIDIKKKMNIDKIGIKTINRYSGFYNPIFNDILYFRDYVYNKTIGRLISEDEFELPYSNTNIDYNYSDGYGSFGVIKNMYYHKTNISRSNNILTFEKPIYPAINECAIDYRDYNIFSSSWDEGYFISQDDLDNSSVCDGIGSMKDGLCMFGSKYLNLPDRIFVDTFENGKIWDDKKITDTRDNTNTEIMYKEINGRTVRYQLFIEKRLKRYLKESLISVFSKYINKQYSFGNKGTIEDDVEEYVEKNLLKLYKVDKIYMYVKEERMRINDKNIENEYLKYVGESNEIKIENGFPVESVGDGVVLKNGKFSIGKINEFDRMITYNLKNGFKESFGFGVSIKRK